MLELEELRVDPPDVDNYQGDLYPAPQDENGGSDRAEDRGTSEDSTLSAVNGHPGETE
jgi:hypothetical protein